MPTVTKVDELSHAKGILRRGDVITHVDGVPVADDGTPSLPCLKFCLSLQSLFKQSCTFSCE